MRSWLLVFGVVVLASSSASQAQAPDVLEGPIEVWVDIKLDEEERKTGLSEEGLRTAVELRLRQSGIRVNSERGQAFSSLYVYVHIIDGAADGFTFTLTVELSETVFPLRYVLKYINDRDKPDEFTTAADLFVNGTPFQATTWSVGTLGTTPRNSARTYVCDTLLEYVDRFANFYLEANPQ